MLAVTQANLLFVRGAKAASVLDARKSIRFVRAVIRSG